MKKFEFGKQEVSYRLRASQPIYQLLEEICLELGVGHPSLLLTKLIQEKSSELRRANAKRNVHKIPSKPLNFTP